MRDLGISGTRGGGGARVFGLVGARRGRAPAHADNLAKDEMRVAALVQHLALLEACFVLQLDECRDFKNR